MRAKMILTAIAMTYFAGSANAITYTGTRTAGTATAQLSITTDDTIGVLTTANVVDWTIAMTDGSSSFTLLGPLSGANSNLLVSGTALSATATDLIFNFSAGSGFALFQAPSVGSGQTFYCPQINGCFDFSGPGEGIDPRNDFLFQRNSLTGSVVLATSGGVPEPATWGMMLGGFSLVGGAMRTRKKATVSFG